MQIVTKLRTCLTVALLPLVALAFSSLVSAQTPESGGPFASALPQPMDLAARYPAGAIKSVETADQALADAEREHAAIEARFADDEMACYPKFFATSCLEAAKERRRLALISVRVVEVASNAVKRHARVVERDQVLAERQAQAELDASQRATELQIKERTTSGRVVASTELRRKEVTRHVPDAGDDKRAENHEIKLKRLAADEAASAQKRAASAAAYEKKVRDAEAHQHQVALKKAEKEQERARKESQAAQP